MLPNAELYCIEDAQYDQVGFTYTRSSWWKCNIESQPYKW